MTPATTSRLPLYTPSPPSTEDLQHYFDCLTSLLEKELQADQARTSLLATNASWDVLAKQGLALNGLGVSGVSVGLGGKSLVNLNRPTAYHNDPNLPSHTFRPGDPAKILPHESVRSKAKTKKVVGGGGEDEKEVEGVVYKTSETTVTLAVTPKEGEDLELPERCRLLKTVNTATFSRMEKAIDRIRRLLAVPRSSPTVAPNPSAGPTPDTSGAVTGEEVEDDQKQTGEKGQEGQLSSVPKAKEKAGGGSSDEDEEDATLRQTDLSPTPNPTDDSTIPPAPNDSSLPRPPPINSLTANQSVPLLRTIFGLSSPSSIPLASSITFYDPTLNDSQREAVQFALESQEIACIHGPPGTGKTYTLVEIIMQLVKTRKQRVLVCGASNLSVDNLLARLSPLFPPQSITRIGHPARILPGLLPSTLDYQTRHSSSGEIVQDVRKELEDDLAKLGKGRKEKGAVKGKERYALYGEVRELRKEFRKREANVVKDVLHSSEIVLATCHTAGARQLFNQDFDVVIIDEATQALEPVCYIPILKAKKLILAGDPNQLPPTIISQSGPARPSTSNASSSVKNPGTNTKSNEGPLDSTTVKEDDTSDTDADKPSPSSPSTTLADLTLQNQPRTTHLRPPRTLSTTLFERLESLYGPCIKRLLNTQYRMNTTIASYPSTSLYQSKLLSHPSVASRTLLSLPSLAPTVDDLSEEDREFLDVPVAFLDTSGCEFYERVEDDGGGGGSAEGSKMNENEGEVVRVYVEKLISIGIQPEDIAVLAAYQAQVGLLVGLLKGKYPELMIGTVDSLQGQEREAVVLSLVRSNEKREVGFLAEERRLNVAMTRAKRHLCVVGDSSTVSNGTPYLKNWMDWLENEADVRYAGDLV